MKTNKELDRLVVEFGLKFLVIRHFPDCLHEIFLHHVIPVSTDGKQTCLRANVTQIRSIEGVRELHYGLKIWNEHVDGLLLGFRGLYHCNELVSEKCNGRMEVEINWMKQNGLGERNMKS